MREEYIRNAGLTEPATSRQREKGYDVFTTTALGNGASHIEKMDCMNTFGSDDEAARYAEEVDGVKLIHDIRFEPGSRHYANYIDTPQNRERLYRLIREDVQAKVSILYGNQIELPIILNEIAKAVKPIGAELTEEQMLDMSMDDFMYLIEHHSGERPKKKMEYHYEKQEVACQVGDVLHNTNGNDYRVMEKYTDRNILFMDVKSGALVVGADVAYFRKLPKPTEEELERAKMLIKEYCGKEFSAQEEFEDYPVVSLGFTEDVIGGSDGDYAIIQSKADLENYKIITEVNGEVVAVEQYETMGDFIEYALENLEFSDLISLSADALAVAKGEKKLEADIAGVSMEWEHGWYLSNVPSEIDFAGLRREFGREPEPNAKGEYDIEIREVLSRTESVKAGFYGEAVDKIMDRYKNGEIVLDAGDFKKVDYLPAKDSRENR